MINAIALNSVILSASANRIEDPNLAYSSLIIFRAKPRLYQSLWCPTGVRTQESVLPCDSSFGEKNQ